MILIGDNMNNEVENKDVPVVENTVEEISEEKVVEEKGVVKEKNFFKDLLPYIVILVIVILIRTYIATPIKVNGPSMEPTLDGGETLILNKLGELDRFKIVVINTSEDHLIKRIVGLPGETVEFVNNKLFIDGKEVADNYGDGTTNDFGPIKLGDSEYFVLGDNRENSTDSRILGPIDEKYIQGTTNFQLFPFNGLGQID